MLVAIVHFYAYRKIMVNPAESVDFYEGSTRMIYLVPGALAGAVFYLLMIGVNMVVEGIWSRKRRLRAHSCLVIHCLVAAAFTFFVVVAGDGGNWATHMQIAGFLLSGCFFSSITALVDAQKSAALTEGGAGTGWGRG